METPGHFLIIFLILCFLCISTHKKREGERQTTTMIKEKKMKEYHNIRFYQLIALTLIFLSYHLNTWLCAFLNDFEIKKYAVSYRNDLSFFRKLLSSVFYQIFFPLIFIFYPQDMFTDNNNGTTKTNVLRENALTVMSLP